MTPEPPPSAPPTLDYAPPAPPRWSYTAIASLLLSLLACFMCLILNEVVCRFATVVASAAILLAVFAWRDIARSEGGLRGMCLAVLGLLLGLLALSAAIF